MRFFVFDKINGSLQVFEKIGGKRNQSFAIADVIQCEEHANLDVITSSRSERDIPTDYTFCFTFLTKTFSLLLWAVSAEERKMWVNSIKTLISATPASEHYAAA